jgi:hypothetical protein
LPLLDRATPIEISPLTIRIAGQPFFRKIEVAAQRSELNIVTSRETWREQDRTRDADVRSQLEQDRRNVEVVRDDHWMLGARATMITTATGAEHLRS